MLVAARRSLILLVLTIQIVHDDIEESTTVPRPPEHGCIATPKR